MKLNIKGQNWKKNQEKYKNIAIKIMRTKNELKNKCKIIKMDEIAKQNN